MCADLEELNPQLTAAQVASIKPKIDWRKAPPFAGAYIAVCVMHDSEIVDDSGSAVASVEVGGCWMIHDSGRRVRAPSFGIDELLPGQSFIIRRPGSQWDGLVILAVSARLNAYNVLDLQRHELTEPPAPGYRPIPQWRTPLFGAIVRVLARYRVAGAIQRGQHRGHFGGVQSGDHKP